jgi:thiol-disulfide isomerase/thioredoxin
MNRRRAIFALLPAATCACTGGHSALADFEARTLEGESFTRASLKGTPVLVQFWATWCGYCRRDEPAVESIAQRRRGRLVVLAVNVGEDDDLVRRYASEARRYSHVVLGRETDLVRRLRPRGFPSYYLIGGDGQVLAEQRGSRGREGLDEMLAEAGL